MKLEIGEFYYISHGRGNPNNKIIQVRGFVDDRVIYILENGRYDMSSKYFFELLEARGKTIRNVSKL